MVHEFGFARQTSLSCLISKRRSSSASVGISEPFIKGLIGAPQRRDSEAMAASHQNLKRTPSVETFTVPAQTRGSGVYQSRAPSWVASSSMVRARRGGLGLRCG